MTSLSPETCQEAGMTCCDALMSGNGCVQSDVVCHWPSRNLYHKMQFDACDGDALQFNHH